MKHIAASIAAVLFIGLSPALAADGTSTVKLDPVVPKQGQTLVVRVPVPDSQNVPTVTFNGKSYRLFPEGGEYRALIGVPADLAPGDYKLSVGDEAQSVHVKAGTFGVQRITLSKDKDNFIASPGEEDLVKRAKQTVTPEKLWTGHFVRPSAARQSSAFGLRRMVNGRLLKDYFHSGMDYAGATGAPVIATQRGRVIIAANKGWRLHGNTVALDHGQGVVSFYIHLSKVLVKPGQIVEAGEQIGKVGATGRATGPHLHFSVYVNGDATNPAEWYTRTI
jgi:murein DD-endopeptidase MepM/ murein hydrolase activator NlpD